MAGMKANSCFAGQAKGTITARSLCDGKKRDRADEKETNQ